MFKFFDDMKIIIRQSKEIIKLKKQIQELEVDVAIQKTLKEQHKNDAIDLLKTVSTRGRKLYDIKYILETEQNEYTAYRKIKNVIFDAQIER